MSAWLPWLRRLPAIAVAAAMLVLLARNADTPTFPDYDLPEGFTPAPPPTTAVPGAERPALLSVQGTTSTTVPPNVGRARLSGTVTGPDGPVPAAVVRIERVVLGTTQVLDVVTGPDGRYDVPGIGGGRYRLRAFLAPTLAQPAGEVLYLRADEERTVDLRVQTFADPSIAVAVAPNPPLLGQQVNIAVRVSGRFVDTEGVVRSQPLAGGFVEVSTTGGWSSPSPSAATTNGDGQVTFSSTCESTAPAQLFVSVEVPAADPLAPPPPPVTTSVELPACVDPATLTTTTTTPTSTPDGSSTTAPGSTTTTAG